MDFVTAKFVMGYHCVRPSILFYFHGPAILHFFRIFSHFLSHLNIKKLLKFKKAAKRPFFNFCPQKGIRSLADKAEHIRQIKRRSDGNCFLKRVNEHSSLVAIVIEGLMICGSKCHQTNLPVVWDGYVKYRYIILID